MGSAGNNHQTALQRNGSLGRDFSVIGEPIIGIGKSDNNDLGIMDPDGQEHTEGREVDMELGKEVSYSQHSKGLKPGRKTPGGEPLPKAAKGAFHLPHCQKLDRRLGLDPLGLFKLP